MKGVFNASVFMGRPLYPADITTTVSVYNAETDELVPTLWLDRDGTDELANPHPLAEDGVILFYADPGRYNIVAEKGTMLYREWPDVIISDSATSGEPGIQSIVPGTNISVDDTDPLNPIVSATGGGGSDRRTVTPVTSSSGIVILDYALGDYFILTLTENVTEWIVVNAPAAPVGGNMMVRIIQDSTPRTNVFPSFFHFTEGSSDEVPSGADEVAILALTSFGDGAWDATMANVPQPPDPDAIPGVPSSAIRIDSETLWTITNWSTPTGWTTDPYAGPYPAKGWGISSSPNSSGPSFSLVPVGGWNVAFRPSKIYVYRWFETGSSIFANRLTVTLDDGSTFVSSTTDSEGALAVDMPGTNSYVTELRFIGINDSGGQSTGLHASVIAYE